MKRMFLGGATAILFSMVLCVGVTGCAGSGGPTYEPGNEDCSRRSSVSTGTKLGRYRCHEGVRRIDYQGASAASR